jgi:hypothetical protein
MEKHSPTDDAPRSDEQQEHERDVERVMLQQEAEHLAHAKYRADSEAGLDGRRVAVPDLAKTRARPTAGHGPRSLQAAESGHPRSAGEIAELPLNQPCGELTASAIG